MGFIRAFSNQISPLSEESLQLFKSIIVTQKFSKKETYVSLGDFTDKFYILKNGVTRAYTTDEKGKVHIRTLFVPITTTGSLSALIKNTPSEATYDCLTECEMLVGDYHAFLKLAQEHHELAIFHAKILENVFIKVVQRIQELTTLNATERYLKLKKDAPNIDNLIQQYHIASYLNITPVQLSRIRKELYSKEK
jgi:CRP-like cAMP-binding protein